MTGAKGVKPSFLIFFFSKPPLPLPLGAGYFFSEILKKSLQSLQSLHFVIYDRIVSQILKND
jgi:hypothetical protein